MRRNLDFYPTPAWATETLMRHVGIRGAVLEPCAGEGAIARVVDGVLEANSGGHVFTSDIDAGWMCSFCGDATRRDFWETVKDTMWNERIDWVVTNPPFNVASEIVPLAYEHADKGIAMLLRLSYLEPVENRGAWLNEHPPTILIVLPRISFTGDGRTDSVCAAWFVWYKNPRRQQVIIAENPRFVEGARCHDRLICEDDGQRSLLSELTGGRSGVADGRTRSGCAVVTAGSAFGSRDMKSAADNLVAVSSLHLPGGK